MNRSRLWRTGLWTALLLLAGFGVGCPPPEVMVDEDDSEEMEGVMEGEQIQLLPEALASLELSFGKAEIRSLAPSLEVPAEIIAIPDRLAAVGPRVAGRVMAVAVNAGDAVVAGSALVLLESHEVGRTWADLLVAQARADVARRAAIRQRGLLEDRVTSARGVEEAEGELQIAEADLQAVRTRLVTFGIDPDGEFPDNPAEVSLKSPQAGTISRRDIQVGQWVEPERTVIEVINLDRLWVLASVYEGEMRHLEVGQDVRVEVRAYPGEVFEGRVDAIDATLDERTRSAQVRIILPNPEHRLKPGMFATARIVGIHAHDERRLLAIPWSAVQEIDDHRMVFVVKGEGLFEPRRVHTGDRAGDLVEILSGLESGEQVVVEGSFLLKGQLLRETLGEDE